MNRLLHLKPNSAYYFFITGIFLTIISPFTFSEGIFMDGLFYSSIARNLSNGVGTFWQAHFSNTLFPSFYEHPPLALGIQSLFFKIIGSSHFTEKIYSLCCIILTGFIICRIWLLMALRHAWIPLCLWLSIPLVQWSSSNNLLENTVSIFTCLSVYFYLKGFKHSSKMYFLTSGSMLILAFLSKGFVGFFPLVFPFFFNLFSRDFSFSRFTKQTLLMCLGIAVPLFLLISFNQQASVSLYTYLNVQVLKSIYFVQTVDSRWYLIQRCIFELIPAFILCAITVFIYKKQNLNIKLNWNKAFPFILVAASAVFPMMISLKQSGFYILPSFPFFALGIGILIYPIVNFLILRIKTHSFSFKVFTSISLLAFCLGLSLSISNAHAVSRDAALLHDIHSIGNYLDDGSTIGISKNLYTDWSLHGYFSRYKSISLDTSTGLQSNYFLTDKNNIADPMKFQKLDFGTKKFNIYRIK